MFRTLRKLFHIIISLCRNFHYFYYPNRIKLLKRTIKCPETPRIHQFLLFTGQGSVSVGDNCTFGFKLGGFHRSGSIEIQARYVKSIVRIGNNTSTNNNIFICAANYVEIGNNVLIGNFVTISDHDAHNTNPNKRNEIGAVGIVKIKNNVWIGNNVRISKNVEIGENSIIASGSVVTKSFPENVIIGGVPAKLIKSI